jgi:hypothetical protein
MMTLGAPPVEDFEAAAQVWWARGAPHRVVGAEQGTALKQLQARAVIHAVCFPAAVD